MRYLGVEKMVRRSNVAGAALALIVLAPAAQGAMHHAAARGAQTTPQTATQVDVMVIDASSGTGGIAPELQSITQLRRPPFSAYTQLALVSRTTVPLGTSPANVSLPNGNAVAVSSRGRTASGRYDVTVQLSLAGRTHNIVFAASPGDPFFTAHSTGPDAALVLGFVVH